jgi:hypothetical protein
MVLASIAAAVVVLLILVPTELDQGGSAAAATLNQLAITAASQSVLGPGQYDYTEVELGPTGVTASSAAGSKGSKGSKGSWTQYSVGTVQTWIAADGSGRQLTSTDLNPQFITTADKKAWAAAGGKYVEPPKYVVTEDQFGPGGKGLSSDQLPVNRLAPYNVAGLPTDPVKLSKALCANPKWRALLSTTSDFNPTLPEPAPSGCRIFGIAVTLLKGPDIGSTPALRQGLFKVLAGVPGVRLLGTVTDALGKRGVGIRLTDRRPAHSGQITCVNENKTPSTTTRIQVHYPSMSTIYTVILDQASATLLSFERSFSPEKIDISAVLVCGSPGQPKRMSEQIPDRSVLISSGIVNSTTSVTKGSVEECAADSTPIPPWNLCQGARPDGDSAVPR